MWKLSIYILYIALFNIGVLSNVEAQSANQPILILPLNGENIITPIPVFSWSSTLPLSAQAAPSFTIHLVEMIGDQSPVAAIQSNPDIVKETDIQANVFSYPAYAQSLQSGRKYAWQVSTFETRSQGESQSTNIIRSEVFWFTYQDLSAVSPSCLGVLTLSKAQLVKKYNALKGELYVSLDSIPDEIRPTLSYSILDYLSQPVDKGNVSPYHIKEQVYVFDLYAIKPLRVRSAKGKLYTLKAKAGNGNEYTVLFFNK